MAASNGKRRARSGLSLGLVVLGAALALIGGVTLYVREEVLDSQAFADRAVAAVHQPTVQHVVARRITVQLVEPGFPDLLAGRPVISSAVRVAITSKPFERVIRLAALHGHRLLFQRNGGNAVFDIADAGKVVASALNNLSPKLARELPKKTEAVLLTLRKRSFASTTLRLGETVRLLGYVLVPVALLLFMAAILVAPDRRRALTRIAVAIGLTGIAFAIAFLLVRRYYVSTARGANEITNAEARTAVDELWGALLGDLMTWTLAITAIAWVVAACTSTVLAPYSGTEGLRRLWTGVPRPATTRGQGVRGAVLLALGVFVVLKPTLALRIAAVGGGLLLVYVGLGELLTATAPAAPRRPRASVSRRRVAAVAGTAVACAVAFGFAFAVVGNSSSVQAKTARTCNGYAQLCSRRLDEVVFAGTHNAMSAADTPGWLIANQDRNLAQQLNDGIRAFKISTHFGVQTRTGQVYTDIQAAGDRVNRVAEQLDAPARLALQRFSRSLHRGGPGSGKRAIWLCHSLCELGATGFAHFLSVIRKFIEGNPGTVIVLLDEDYVPESSLRAAFAQAGLFDRLAVLQRGQPLPTLGQLISSRHNIVVFAQEPVSGHFPWNAPQFTWTQDTPLQAVKPSQFTCQLYRGYSANPLLVMNNWADVFPPRPSPNVPLVQKDFILRRAHECVTERGKIPNLIMTDFYDRGDVVGAASVLNGVAGERPAPIEQVEFG